MPSPSEGKLLYHITHIDNMPSILEHGLLPRSEMTKKGLYFTDIADPEILSKRKSYEETLSKYVLFHFYARNPFDGAVCQKYGAENMAIITIKRDLHLKYDFSIIPSHPLDREKPDIYSYEEGFKKIRWEILDKASGRDYHDPEIRKACMAECIVPYTIPPEFFSYVFVKDIAAQKKILHMKNSDLITIRINDRMFP